MNLIYIKHDTSLLYTIRSFLPQLDLPFLRPYNVDSSHKSQAYGFASRPLLNIQEQNAGDSVECRIAGVEPSATLTGCAG